MKLPNYLQRRSAEIAGLEQLLSEMPDNPLTKPLLESRLKEEKRDLEIEIALLYQGLPAKNEIPNYFWGVSLL